VEVTSQFDLNAGLLGGLVSNSGTATCPGNATLVTGGYSSTQSDGQTIPINNIFVATTNRATTPGKGGTWTVAITDVLGASAVGGNFDIVTVYALCAT